MGKKKNINESQQPVKAVTAGLDIGTTKICAIVSEPGEQHKSLKILGLGITESMGLNRGVVVNIDKTVKAIQKVIEQAEQQSGLMIKDLVVGIAGDHVESEQSRGIVGISSQTQEISEQDVLRAVEDSRKLAVPAERQIIHVIPQDYIIDGQDGITDPVGMSGVRMEANVHVITGLKTAIQNIIRCVERSKLSIHDLVLEPLASSSAILTEEEKEVGVAMIDIGGGTTDIAIFHENVLRWTSVIGIAGKQVTNDIRQGLGILGKDAEKVKQQYGHSFLHSISKDDVFMVPGINGRKPTEITKSYLCRIIQPRMEEIFEFSLSEIRRSGFADKLGAGVVITGGSALLRGTDELAAQVFGMPVKLGIPSGISYKGLAPEIESPVYSTAVGLAHRAMGYDDTRMYVDQQEEMPKNGSKNNGKPQKDKKSFFTRIKSFIEEL